jgi:hypothetical protein
MDLCQGSKFKHFRLSGNAKTSPEIGGLPLSTDKTHKTA